MRKGVFFLLTSLFGLLFYFPAVAQSADHIVISQIQIDGIDGTGGTAQDFVEFYNPTNQQIDISGWKLRKKATDGSESSVRVFPSGSNIPAFGFFLWARSSEAGFAESLGADATSTASLIDNNSIALKDSADNLIDAVAWGSGHIDLFIEGVAAPNPDDGGSLERYPGSGQGNGQDAGDNSADFFAQATPHPRNTSSPSEQPTQPLEQDDEPDESDETAEDDEEEQAPVSGGGSSFAIEINEILPNPDGTDSGNEWVELYNPSIADADLSGWFLDDDGPEGRMGSSAYELPPGSIVKAKSYLAVYIPKGRFALNNSQGDDVRLFTDNKVLWLKQSYPGPAKSGESFARNSNNQWEWTSAVTPGAKNQFIELVKVEPTVRISEVLPNPFGDDAEGEFIELYNYGSDDIDLTDWSVADARKKFTLSEDDFFELEIGAKGYFVIYREVSGISLNNSGAEKTLLYDPNGEPVSEIEFDAKGREGQSYALASGQKYEWTIQPTPGTENIIQTNSKPADKSAKAEPEQDEPEQEPVEAPESETAPVSLDEVRALEPGTKILTEGVVSVPLGVFGEQVLYLAGSGLRIFVSGENLSAFNLGDKIRLTGELSSFHNELQLKINNLGDIEVLESGVPVAPIEMITGEIGEGVEGYLVHISGTVTKNQGNTFFIDDGTGEARILIQEATKIVKPEIRKGDEIGVIGVVSQFNEVYRILPRFQEDLTAGAVLGAKTLPRTGNNFWLNLAVFEAFLLILLVYFGLIKGKSLHR